MENTDFFICNFGITFQKNKYFLNSSQGNVYFNVVVLINSRSIKKINLPNKKKLIQACNLTYNFIRYRFFQNFFFLEKICIIKKENREVVISFTDFKCRKAHIKIFLIEIYNSFYLKLIEFLQRKSEKDKVNTFLSQSKIESISFKSIICNSFIFQNINK